MLCVLSVQDWLAIDEKLRLPDADAERINIPANPGSAPCVYAVAIYAGIGLQHQGALPGLGIEEIRLVLAGADGEFVWCHLADVADGIAPFMFALWLHLDKLGDCRAEPCCSSRCIYSNHRRPHPPQ